MTNTESTFPALSRCVHFDGRVSPVLPSIDEAAYRELWAARCLVASARCVLASARWDAEHPDDHATVPKHDLVLLEAAFDLVTGHRAHTRDGFPHAGAAVTARGTCSAGYCPCHDGRQRAQQRLLDRAA